MRKKSPLTILLVSLCLSACSRDYPLVANIYPKTADLSALDGKGLGSFATPVEPKGCLLAFKSMPDISTTQIRVVVEGETDVTYDSAALAKALNGQDFTGGVFMVGPPGIWFEKGYECDSEAR